MKAAELIGRYTAGEATLEETNEALRAAGAGFHLEPERNTLTEEELWATTVGVYPQQACGWGLLDTGTGSLDKVHITNGRLDSGDLGEMRGLVFIAGKRYRVSGRSLA